MENMKDTSPSNEVIKFIDSVSANIPMTKGDGSMPIFTDQTIGKLKRKFHLDIDQDGLKELNVDYYKVIKKDFSKLDLLSDGSIDGYPSLKIKLYAIDRFIPFENVKIGACFSFKFYCESLWESGSEAFYFEDMNGYTELFRNFSSEAPEAVLEKLMNWETLGKVIKL